MDLCAGLYVFFHSTQHQCQTGWNALPRLIGSKRQSVRCWLSRKHLRTIADVHSVHVLIPREPRMQYTCVACIRKNILLSYLVI